MSAKMGRRSLLFIFVFVALPTWAQTQTPMQNRPQPTQATWATPRVVCEVDRRDPQIAFLHYIQEIYSSLFAVNVLNSACAEIDYFGRNTGEFGEFMPMPLRDRAIGAVQAILSPVIAGRAALIREEAQSARKLAEMREKQPEFMQRLDEFKQEQDPMTRLKLTYNFITSRTRYDEAVMTNPLRLGNTDPVDSANRVMKREPIGVCVHYAGLLNFALYYVGPGPGARNFSVSTNVGNIHAWNHVEWTNTENQRIQFDLDATHFERFTPLSISHWDVTVRAETRPRILAACRRVKQCLQQALR